MLKKIKIYLPSFLTNRCLDKLEFVIQREMNREENAFLSSHP